MNDAHSKTTHEPKDPAGNHFPGGHMGGGGDHESRIAALEDFKSFVLRFMYGSDQHFSVTESDIKAIEKDIVRLERRVEEAFRNVREVLK